MGGMITAGLKGLASNLAAKTATAKGNVLKGLKGLRDKGVVKNVLRSMAMVGLTTFILGNSAVAELDGLPKKLAQAATKATISMAMDVAIDGIKPSEAAKNAARSTIADTIASTGAAKLGQAYHDGNLPDGIVEALHSVVGAFNAKIMNEDALSGAIGAIAGEIAGKVYRNANPDKFGDNGHKINNLERDANVSFATDLAKITAAAVATAMNLDPNVAVRTAEIAAVNNAYGMYHTTGKLFDQQGEPLNPEEVEAAVDTAKEILIEIRDNPEVFFEGCADIGTDMIIPGGNKHIKNLLNGKEDLSTFATNQKRSIGEEVAMGMMVGGKIAKGSKKFKAVVKYVDGKYQAKLQKALKNSEAKKSKPKKILKFSKPKSGYDKLREVRKRYGIDGNQFPAHHIISHTNKNVKNHPLWKKAGMDPNDYVMLLPGRKGVDLTTTKRTPHIGRHPDSVSIDHRIKMDEFLDKGRNNNWSQAQYKKAFEGFIRSERKLLKEGKVTLDKSINTN